MNTFRCSPQQLRNAATNADTIWHICGLNRNLDAYLLQATGALFGGGTGKDLWAVVSHTLGGTRTGMCSSLRWPGLPSEYGFSGANRDIVVVTFLAQPKVTCPMVWLPFRLVSIEFISHLKGAG